MTSEPASPSGVTDNRLAFLDQAAFLRLRATGQDTAGQVTWIYDRAVDMEGLRRFNENLGRGLLGRRIERSPLPFGRHHWIVCHDAPDIAIAPSPRPRSEIGAWLDERGQIPVDPEYGPSWHIGLLPLEDGGAAVTLVTSHTVVDGAAIVIAIWEAVHGQTREFGYPPARSRSRLRGVLVDGLDALRGLPEVFTALIAGIALLLNRGRESASRPKLPTVPFSAPDEPIVLPSLTLFCDLAEWDTRAHELRGNSNALFIAFAAGLAQRMGRVNPTDGFVAISVPVNQRATDDVRGNALTGLNFRVDPVRSATDLQLIRNEMKQGLANLQKNPDELLKPLPLVPYTPKWLARKAEGLAVGNADSPVGCSNMKAVPQELGHVDGSSSAYFSGRIFNQGATARSVEQAHGQLYLVSAQVNDRVSVGVTAYQPGAVNSTKHLRDLVEETLAEYRLTSVMDL
jgi:diacylglycerol O-acyltransferase / wax synthase